MRITVFLFLLFSFIIVSAKDFRLNRGTDVFISIDKGEEPVVETALDILKKDIKVVLDTDLRETSDVDKAHIIAGFDKDIKREGFRLCVNAEGKLEVYGADGHGLAYGLLEISRVIGVSPWEWWADVKPESKKKIVLGSGFIMQHSPSVDYRGIFINDEDWGLMPWSSATHEPDTERGVIGPKTNARIFELLLRLRANYYWPAMHECTRPFFLTEGNREVAAKYGIYIGGSHCEPMASSTAVEWGVRGKGDYDYVNNADEVRRFWTERVRDVKNQEIVYTIGMRGVHDGKMQGAKTLDEQKSVLQRVIHDQRAILSEYVDSNVERVPQVFIPYKEVLDIYNAGLEVPDDVTLMWCDDNYGFIRHFPTEAERSRKGGNGIYYHVSYWGRPHDYLWLCTVPPSLVFQQMTEAYDRGIQRMWILNVGDIKPAEYQIELFLDMAWDIQSVREKGVERHQRDFLAREFGAANARRLMPLMAEHYRLASVRRPEFMGGTRTEESNRAYWNLVRDLPWTDGYIEARIDDYRRLSDRVEKVARKIDAERCDAFLQLVKYPLLGTAQMNFKTLHAQRARNGHADEWTMAVQAYDSISALTLMYNAGIYNNGKWNGIMDMHPRRLSVYGKLEQPKSRAAIDTGPSTADVEQFLPEEMRMKLLFDEDTDGCGKPLVKGESVSCEFVERAYLGDSIELEVRLLPTHPVAGDKLRFTVSVDGTSVTHEYQTYGRSEEWKRNILRGYAVRRFRMPLSAKRKHSLVFTSEDEGVVLKKIYGGRRGELF